MILRGGANGPNYAADHIARAAAALARADLAPRVLIDCSHANSGKDPARQPDVLREVAAQVAAGNPSILGVMLESFLVGGRQDVVTGTPLVYGQSITDGCLGWDATVPLLHELAGAVRSARAGAAVKAPLA